MAELTPIYDLMLLLRTSVEDERRLQIRADVEQLIADNGGQIELTQEWGVRPLTFEIDHIREAEYHLLQFSGPSEIVDTLNYDLKINDGVLRHRIIKVIPGMPETLPDPPAGAIGAVPADAAVESAA